MKAVFKKGMTICYLAKMLIEDFITVQLQTK